MSNNKGKHIFLYDSVRKLLDTPLYMINWFKKKVGSENEFLHMCS